MGRAKSRRPPPDQGRQQVIRFPAGRKTPAQVAKVSVAKRPGPPGQPELAALTLRLSLRREALERLTARAIAQGRKLEALIQELLEHAAEDG